MISERQLAKKYSSIWNELLPMSDRFMRRLNLEAKRYVEPFSSNIPPAYNALINEVSYRLYKHKNKLDNFDADADADANEYDRVFSDAKVYIEKLSNQSLKLNLDLKVAIDHDIQLLCDRLSLFYEQNNEKNIQFDPEFNGCGIIDACFGDIVAGETLYEIKAGAREFRAIDLRQLIIYLALNAQSKSFDIKNIALLNPRTGKYWIEDVNEVFLSVSGSTSVEILSNFIAIVSQDRLSH